MNWQLTTKSVKYIKTALYISAKKFSFAQRGDGRPSLRSANDKHACKMHTCHCKNEKIAENFKPHGRLVVLL